MSVIAGQVPASPDETILVYDGACPFCSRYVKLLRLRAAVGDVRLQDARDGGAVVAEIQAQGLSLDEGMVLIHQGQYHHGADCLHRLALMTTPSGAFNRLTASVFRSRRLSRAVYPALRCGRNAVLFLLGRPRLSVPRRAPHSPRRHRLLVAAVPVLLMSYCAIALSYPWIGRHVPNRASEELFPFFNWSLFSSPRAEAGRYTVRITAVRPPEDYGASLLGRTLDDIDTLGIQTNIRFHKTARALARAHRRQDDAKVERLRVMLSNFLRPYGITEVELLRYTYDPLAYYGAGEINAQAVLGRFKLDDPP